MSITGPILVFLANGVQGGAVVQAALRRGHPVRRLVRRPQGSDPVGTETVLGDLDDPRSLAVACAGVAHLVLQVPTGDAAEMARRAQSVVDAARQAGVRSLVLKLASASRPAPCAEPSFIANAAVEAVVRAAGLPCAVLRPTMYLDNLLKPSVTADIVRHGVFSPPIAAEQRIAWTCADDCAEAAIRLLERGAYGGDHCIAGPVSATGPELAATVAKAIGKPVAYHAQLIERFEAEVDAAMGQGAGRRIASKFRYFAERPQEADDILARPFQPTSALAGFTPTPIEDWIGRHAARFR
ncbi:uncharacterized protein YbjT (DUF2867 family) [Brevundimonas sp. SORGH_AS 993]|nr:uncharacterized protein YbjT (DUF2867 family) [Brevundimonas sp. SORGH_AS_0993]